MVKNIIHKLTQWLFGISCVITFFLAVVVFYNVILRYIFNMPTYWSTEVSSIMLILLTFLASAEILKERRHIKFTLIYELLSSRNKYLAEVISALFGIIFFVVLGWESWETTKMVFLKNIRLPSLLGTPLFIPYFFIALGSFMLILQLLIRVKDDIQSLMKGDKK
jgi:C4-dicarboxylate transporter, DctQ subunit